MLNWLAEASTETLVALRAQLQKYSPDQDRDERGRFAYEGGPGAAAARAANAWSRDPATRGAAMDWAAGMHDSMREYLARANSLDPSSHQATVLKEATLLVAAVAASTPTDYRLYRGIGLDDGPYAKFLETFQPGKSVDLNLSSWTRDQAFAAAFASNSWGTQRPVDREYTPAHQVIFVLERGAHALDISEQVTEIQSKAYDEHLTAGRFTVESVYHGEVKNIVSLRQTATLPAPALIGTKLSAIVGPVQFLDWLESFMTPRMVPSKDLVQKYDENEPRDEAGRWADGGASDGHNVAQLSSATQDRILTTVHRLQQEFPGYDKVRVTTDKPPGGWQRNTSAEAVGGTIFLNPNQWLYDRLLDLHDPRFGVSTVEGTITHEFGHIMETRIWSQWERTWLAGDRQNPGIDRAYRLLMDTRYGRGRGSNASPYGSEKGKYGIGKRENWAEWFSIAFTPGNARYDEPRASNMRSVLAEAGLYKPKAEKAGPPDEPRDERGQWTDGGAVATQSPEFASALQSWTGFSDYDNVGNTVIDSHTVMRQALADPERAVPDTLQHAEALLRGTAESEPTKDRLFRGINVDAATYDHYVGLKPGDTVRMNLSSWSGEAGPAFRYAREGEGKPILFIVAPGAHAFDVMERTPLAWEHEFLASGAFRVVASRVDPDGLLRLGLRQIEPFRTSAQTAGTKADDPDLVKYDENEPRDERGRWTDGGPDVPPNGKGHEIIRGANIWGFSHGASRQITSETAKIMGIPGYEINPRAEHTEWATGRTAERFLVAISKDKLGSEEPLYHGFQNLAKTEYHVGDSLALPAMATAGDRTDAAGYGTRLDPKDQEGTITVFKFPVGTPMAGYDRWRPSDQRVFGHIWSEAIVAGKFVVTSVSNDHGVSGHWADPVVQTVSLLPKETFDPVTGSWLPTKTRLLDG